ncbi:hypothetical protein V8F06_006057 [Rhypophila decipiens]
MSYYRAAPAMSSDMGNNRQASYHAYLSAQTGNQHEVPASHGHHIGQPADNMGALMNQFGNMILSSGPNMSSGSLSSVQPHHGYCATQEQQVAYQGYPVPMHVGMAPETTYPFSVPGLDNRRSSYSTTESTPETPFFGSTSERGSAARVAVIRSAYSTPSSDQLMVPNGIPKVSQPIDEDLLGLLKQEPAIPDAVPAVFTPPTHTKSIEQCLENRINGNRNVYIRGLHPTTDDELLNKYASRFGPVEQSKAIIDQSTGACKGFGFAKFADVRDSERCIRGFYHLGYEVGFARESFNARLKAEGDETSTNLYLSNLPKRMTESELNTIFTGYHVISSKILRDSMGNSRGVGFARFESRDECEDIIRHYHGRLIGEEQMPMQVRYADTPSQKELKRITAERRQFRTNEYNIGAYGTADVGIHPSIYQQAPWNRRASPGVSVNSSSLATLTSLTMDQLVCWKASNSWCREQWKPAVLAVSWRRPLKVRRPPTRWFVRETNQILRQSSVITGQMASDDDSADEGHTIVGSPTIAKGSTQSSPTIKKEKS